MKLVSVIGVPKPLESVFSIADIEKEEDKDWSFSRSVSNLAEVGTKSFTNSIASTERIGNLAKPTKSAERTGWLRSTSTTMRLLRKGWLLTKTSVSRLAFIQAQADRIHTDDLCRMALD